ncbi:MAG: hypothetical protein ACFFB2_08335 [Promethearchaeota archaeon]
MKSRRKESEMETNCHISDQISIFINLKTKNDFFDKLYTTPLSKVEEDEIFIYIIKAQEIVTKWNEGQIEE